MRRRFGIDPEYKKILLERQNAEKKIRFCDKCGEAYQTDKEHKCDLPLCVQCHKNGVDFEEVHGVLSKSSICRECKEINFKSLINSQSPTTIK